MRISDWSSDVCSSDLGAGAGVALGHVGGALDVAGQDMVDRLALLHGGVERVDRRAGNAEGDVDPLLLQDAHGGFGCGHKGHRGSSAPVWLLSVCLSA